MISGGIMRIVAASLATKPWSMRGFISAANPADVIDSAIMPITAYTNIDLYGQA